MDTKEALKSFELDARLFYDAIAFSTDDYLYIIDMQRDIALVSDNMRDDFDLPDSLVPGLIPLWRELIVERDRKRFDDSIDSMLSGETDCHDLEYQVKNALGESIWVMCRGLLKRDENGQPTMFAGVVTVWSARVKSTRSPGCSRTTNARTSSIGSSPANRRAASCCWGSMTFLASTC